MYKTMQLPANLSNDNTNLVTDLLKETAETGDVEAMKELRRIGQAEYHDCLISLIDDDEYTT